MGVPSFFRWLLEKYPRVIQYVREENVEYDEQMQRVIPEASAPNPNGVEFDNLYLDMNGIIHPMCHPETGPRPESEEQMMDAICHYIELLFSIVRPRKVLFLAIDGVAPRAKMNQQRARRFRSAQQMARDCGLRQKLAAFYETKGMQPPAATQPWDHNVITPGTPFMDRLATRLREWLPHKLATDAAWKSVKVILSDANVPGEGEHKIADFIRRLRHSKAHDPNTHHVLHGLDADLFMLGLATHEPYFTILREEVLFGRNRPCHKCGEMGHFADRCRNEELAKKKEEEKGKRQPLKPFVFAHLWVLREYLQRELYIERLPFAWDFECIIDDFVFLCFFVGNDFLPHLPSLEIREGAVDNLLKMYTDFLPALGGYLTEGNGKVNLPRVNYLLERLGEIEDEVLSKRKVDDQRWKERTQRRKEMDARRKASRSTGDLTTTGIPAVKRRKVATTAASTATATSTGDTVHASDIAIATMQLDGATESSSAAATKSMCDIEVDTFDKDKAVLDSLFDDFELETDDHFFAMDFEHKLRRIKRAASDLSKCKSEKKIAMRTDTVDLGGEFGWKLRYYKAKFDVCELSSALLCTVRGEYLRGLCWVMAYYYRGCVDWGWFYPFHYAPFASDLCGDACLKLELDFDTESRPFSPFAQLMGVLPFRSGRIALPKPLSDLMRAPLSPIIDFYPTDFRLDLNGKKFEWQGVVILPFIDEKRLLQTIAPIEKALMRKSKEIARQNGVGKALLFVHSTHSLRKTMSDNIVTWKMAFDEEIERRKKSAEESDSVVSAEEKSGIKEISPISVKPFHVEIDPTEAGGIAGYLTADERCIVDTDVVSCGYEYPQQRAHCSQLLTGTVFPQRALDERDFDHMLNAPRFGKARRRQTRMDSSHNRFNAGWAWAAGHEEGRVRALARGESRQFALDYQPTRGEFEAKRKRAQVREQFLTGDRQTATTTTTTAAAISSASADGSGGIGTVETKPVTYEPFPAVGDPYAIARSQMEEGKGMYAHMRQRGDGYGAGSRGRGGVRDRGYGRGYDRGYDRGRGRDYGRGRGHHMGGGMPMHRPPPTAPQPPVHFGAPRPPVHGAYGAPQPAAHGGYGAARYGRGAHYGARHGSVPGHGAHAHPSYGGRGAAYGGGFGGGMPQTAPYAAGTGPGYGGGYSGFDYGTGAATFSGYDYGQRGAATGAPSAYAPMHGTGAHPHAATGHPMPPSSVRPSHATAPSAGTGVPDASGTQAPEHSGPSGKWV